MTHSFSAKSLEPSFRRSRVSCTSLVVFLSYLLHSLCFPTLTPFNIVSLFWHCPRREPFVVPKSSRQLLCRLGSQFHRPDSRSTATASLFCLSVDSFYSIRRSDIRFAHCRRSVSSPTFSNAARSRRHVPVRRAKAFQCVDFRNKHRGLAARRTLRPADTQTRRRQQALRFTATYGLRKRIARQRLQKLPYSGRFSSRLLSSRKTRHRPCAALHETHREYHTTPPAWR